MDHGFMGGPLSREAHGLRGGDFGGLPRVQKMLATQRMGFV